MIAMMDKTNMIRLDHVQSYLCKLPDVDHMLHSLVHACGSCEVLEAHLGHDPTARRPCHYDG